MPENEKRNIIFGTLKISQNDPEIPNLEFESHSFLENKVFLPTEQAGTNICWMIYQEINFKICLSLFGWKENIKNTVQTAHCALETYIVATLIHLLCNVQYGRCIKMALGYR